MTDRPLVILDFETTGLGVYDRVIEIAALRVDTRGETEFHRLCNPGRPLPSFIRELHAAVLADRPVRALDDVRATHRLLEILVAGAGQMGIDPLNNCPGARRYKRRRPPVPHFGGMSVTANERVLAAIHLAAAPICAGAAPPVVQPATGEGSA